MTLAISAVAVLAIIALIGFADSASAGTFTPTLKVTVAKTTPDTPSDYVVDFGIPKGDVNFAGVVSFIPKDWGIVPGDAFPIGTGVGGLDAKATLGLINGACNSVLPVHFDFKNSSLDTSDTVAYYPANDDDTTPDFAEDKDNNGNFDAVDKYPDFLARVFKEIKPIRRSAGLTLVAGLPIMLQFLIFAPGTEINENIPHDESLGFPTVTVLTNAGDTDAAPAPGAITDFCSALTSVNTSLGAAEDGTQLFVNPQNGKYDFVTVGVGLRDTDGDGYENNLDTCQLTANVGNPRVAGDGDNDSDGLDAACDPDDNDTNSDEDLDGYLNRQDNCTLKANGEDADNQADKDLDQIGDACDNAPDKADGELSVKELKASVTIGDGTGPGGPPTSCDKCYKSGQANGGGGTTTGGGSDTGLIVGIIVGVIAAIVVLGGGAYFLMQRGRRGA
ncbi:MAG: thrombospondin type 3 repeat-containing protein [Dehalococcoidia bacterium]|nr:thrombospondin type 3 repeat-containing protein [Dehalococcoidia bacterium]